MDKFFELLLSTPLFKGITQQQLPALLSCLHATKKRYEKGAYIFVEGNKTNYIGILLHGSAQVVQDDFTGHCTILAELFSGDLFGETFACAHLQALPVSVIATQKTDILFFDYERVIANCSIACDFHSKLLENMLAVLAQKNLFLNSKIKHLGQRSIREKLLSYLNEQAQHAGNQSFSISLNRQELADYLCVDRSALSSELGRMQKQGILSFHRNMFTLLQ